MYIIVVNNILSDMGSFGISLKILKFITSIRTFSSYFIYQKSEFLHHKISMKYFLPVTVATAVSVG